MKKQKWKEGIVGAQTLKLKLLKFMEIVKSWKSTQEI